MPKRVAVVLLAAHPAQTARLLFKTTKPDALAVATHI